METRLIIIFWVSFVIIALISKQAHKKFKAETADMRAMLAKEEEERAKHKGQLGQD